ncbi:alpha/beta hydrolase [Peribacillus sp. NPDC096379]|uniref:alpha/beta hydrolase n=1 Tax=Peribacillus sp. NPDC096379 TaxID=3364393 RepID=UPI00382CB23D
MNEQTISFIEFMKKNKSKMISSSLEERREAIQFLGDRIQIPVNIEVTEETIGEVNCEWISLKDASSDSVVINIHGGAYVMGSAYAARGTAITLATLSRSRVISIDYRLAPENPFPAALDDVLAVYRALLDKGISSSKIVLYGESAGGGLVLAVILMLRDFGKDQPAAVICSSPWADLTNSGGSHTWEIENKDFTLTTEDLNGQAFMYAGGESLTNPYISPIFADFSNVPPLLIYAGTNEILLNDSISLAERATQAGVEVTIRVVDNMPHCFTAMTGLFEEADQAMTEIAEFIIRKKNLYDWMNNR